MENLDDLLDIDEASKYLHISKSTLYKWTMPKAEKHLPTIKLNSGKILFHKRALLEFVLSKQV